MSVPPDPLQPDTPLLQIRGLHAGYGGAEVLRGVDLEIASGEIVTLLGRNGAGRSTLLKSIIGLLPATVGEIRFAGASLLGLPTYAIARRGISWVAEDRAVFPELTVAQNLLLGLPAGRRATRPSRVTWASQRDAWRVVQDWKLFSVLEARRDTPAGLLSGGEQQLLSLARAVLGEPRLMLVDEPTEGLAPQLVTQVADFLLALRERGIAVLLVEQKLGMALSISQRVVVLGHGCCVFRGTAQAFQADPGISREWLEVG